MCQFSSYFTADARRWWIVFLISGTETNNDCKVSFFFFPSSSLQFLDQSCLRPKNSFEVLQVKLYFQFQALHWRGLRWRRRHLKAPFPGRYNSSFWPPTIALAALPAHGADMWSHDRQGCIKKGFLVRWMIELCLCGCEDKSWTYC